MHYNSHLISLQKKKIVPNDILYTHTRTHTRTHTHTHTHTYTHTHTRDIQERYRTLAMYSQPVTEEEQQWCAQLEPQWKELAAKARQKDRDIIPDKRRFTVVSILQLVQ